MSSHYSDGFFCPSKFTKATNCHKDIFKLSPDESIVNIIFVDNLWINIHLTNGSRIDKYTVYDRDNNTVYG